MDKIKINNQVVAMRKFVKQAKIRTINKCVKEIKLLQNRKGNENQVSKCKRKADRLLLEVALLKKIKPDTVSKMALSKAKDWKAILTQKNVPLEERSFAILASYEPVQAEVEKFHSANSYLVPKIATLVQEWEEKAKLASQNPQDNEKGFQNNNKRFEKSGKESRIKLSQSNSTQIGEKPETGNAQLKSLPCIIPKKPLVKEENEMSDEGNNTSDSGSEEDDESMEENEELPEENNLNNVESQKVLEISQNESDVLENNSKCSETDSASSDDESGTENSEEDSANTSAKSLEPFNNAVASQESELIVKSVKNKPEHPKVSSTETNKSSKEQPTLQKSFSPEPNSTKAVALINLNEMLDMDEIPIDNGRATVEAAEGTGKRKRDAFFLTGNDDDFSEGDSNEDSDDGSRETNHSPLKKKQRNNFNKKGSYNEGFKDERNGFKNRQNFGNSPGFREKSFRKSNKDFYSKEHSNDSGRNPGRGENRFNKNKFTNFDKNDKRPENRFNKNKFNNFDKNDKRPENRFNKNKFNNFDKNDKRPENQFNKNKKWNTFDKNESTERKPFKNSAGKTFVRNMTHNKSRNDYPSKKPENFNKAGGKKDETPLHPSWEAKRKLKSSQKAKFQGKRVVFND